MNLFAILLRAAGIWCLSLIVSIVLILITAGLTQKLGASRTQWIAGILLVLIVAIFVVATVFVHSYSKQLISGSGWIFTLVYAGGNLITVLIMGFMTLVALNR